MKRVMAIHDLSCYGKASLTTIIPIISVMGIEVCPMPTAVLSTHTGGFGTPEFLDLTNFLEGTKKHWKNLKLEFNAIYTGYLGSSKQGELIKSIVEDFKKENTILVVDPVMGDEGKLYSSLDNTMVKTMRELVEIAEVITPNLTEVALLLNKNFDAINNAKDIEFLIKELSELGPKGIVVTSVPSIKGDEYLDTVTYNKKENLIKRISVKRINSYYPGTGDAFAAVLTAKLMKGYSLEDGAEFASNYISKAIEISNGYDYDSKEGILLEKTLKYLLD
ncbi:MAG: pyridoxamine kinase [Sarcina sp.]